MARAFEGIKVIDFTQVLAGPVATQQLAFLGADVVKVEALGNGESGRHLRAYKDPSPENMGSIFLSVNAGKRSLSIDLKQPHAKAVIHRMVANADVVVQNFKAGVIDKLGFGYEALAEHNPKLIYCSISGYGQKGPRASAAAYDPAVQGSSGMMHLTGTKDSGPLRTGFPVVDIGTGLYAAIAIFGALYRRTQTGKGQFLDVAMLDSAMSLMTLSYMAFMRTGIEPSLMGNQTQLRIPTVDVFPTGEGYIQISAFTDAQARALCSALKVEELLEDERFATAEARVENRHAFRELLVTAFASRSALEWEPYLGECQIPASAVLTLPQALAQEQLNHRDFLSKAMFPKGFDEPVTFFNAPYDASEDSPGVDIPPPAVGEHSEDVLAEFGFSEQEIEDLKNKKVISE
ncbi:MAG: CoA transferase [Pseudomonadales bacterium]|nr:CoA transferase [Pseudomonadales bacterium]